MFRIFRRRKDKPALAYSVMQRFSDFAERRQRKIAAYLNNRTKHYSKRKWRWLLAGFCILFSAASIEIFIDSMRTAKHPENTAPANISVPEFIGRHDKMADSIEDFERWYSEHSDSIKKRKR